MPNVGEKHHCAKLTENMVRIMRWMHEYEGTPVKDIIHLFPVSITTASKAIHRVTWRCVE